MITHGKLSHNKKEAIINEKKSYINSLSWYITWMSYKFNQSPVIQLHWENG